MLYKVNKNTSGSVHLVTADVDGIFQTVLYVLLQCF